MERGQRGGRERGCKGGKEAGSEMAKLFLEDVLFM